jgi:hypothetical protein
MGATVFMQRAKGATAKEAFAEAVRQAQYDWGHAGYTGTVAEKDSFVIIQQVEGLGAEELADKLIDERDERIDDKWGDAGCIPVKDGEWLFFGWASC